MANIYLAGDWRQQDVFDTVTVTLRGEGHHVVDPRESALAQEGDELHATIGDLAAMIPWERDDREQIAGSDFLVLILPAGKDAHADYGYACAVGVTTVVLITAPVKAKAVYAWADAVVVGMQALLEELDLHTNPDQRDLAEGLPTP